jgi:integrase
VTLGDGLSAWLEQGRWRYTTAWARRQTARGLVEALGAGRAVESVTALEVSQWLDERYRGRKGSYVNCARRMLATWFRWMVNAGMVERSIMDLVQTRQEEKRQPRTLREGEEESLLLHLRERVKDAVVVALETGLRERCVLDMRPSWVQSGWLHVPASSTKTRTELRVPLSLRAREALSRAAAARTEPLSPESRFFPFSGQLLRLRFREAADAAGLHGVRFHDLRATFVSRLRKRGVRIEVAAALAGHSDPKTTLRHYVSIDDEAMQEAIR